jgi:TolB-like protein/AraC-like DNA-binding protein/Tfp pilus assembly protein PilF
MNQPLSMDQAFLNKLTEIVKSNLENEKFGVEELVHEAGMSRYKIYYKLKSLSKGSISQFIRDIRLHRAHEMLQQDVATASEIAYRTGFSSPTYFSKCFHDYYGYPPGEVRKRQSGSFDNIVVQSKRDKNTANPGLTKAKAILVIRRLVNRRNLFIILAIILAFLSAFFILNSNLFRNFYGSREIFAEHHDKSIIVLPFKNLSNAVENQYFADGVVDDILNHLCRIRGLRVISSTTAAQFRGGSLTTPKIARKVNALFALEGSIQRYEHNVRIHVQLIDAMHDQHIWSEKYDREMTDILAIQSDIAKQIAIELQIFLSNSEIKEIEKVPTKNIEAYNSYLKGRFFLNNWNIKCFEYFEQSIAEDPQFAPAIAGLADAYLFHANVGLSPMLEGYARSKELALKALDIDENLAEAHATLGYILAYGEFKWEDSKKELIHAIDLNPNYAYAHRYYANLLYTIGQKEEARNQINLAIQLDPLSLLLLFISAGYYIDESKYKEAMDELGKIMEIHPDNVGALWLYWEIYVRKGEGLKALEILQKISRSFPEWSQSTNDLRNIYNASGLTGLYKLIIDWQMKAPNPNPMILSAYYALLDQKDEAMDWLEKEFKRRSSNIGNNYPAYICDIYHTWQLEKLRSESRLLALIEKMGLSNYYNIPAASKNPPKYP